MSFLILTISAAKRAESTEVLYGATDVVEAVSRFTANAEKKIDACVDYTRPALAVGIEPIKKSFLDAKNRGVNFRYITEITKDNIPYCKELTKMVKHLRHLDGIRGAFYVSDIEYIAPAAFHEKGKTASQIIYSNVTEIIEQQQYLFETLWNKAVPAKQKIREIEEGMVRHQTRIIDDPDKTVKKLANIYELSDEMRICGTTGIMRFRRNHLLAITRKISERCKQGEHKGIKFISSIYKDDIKLTEMFLDLGMEIRHIKNLPSMNFIVSDKEVAATIENLEERKIPTSLLVSNEPAYMNHFTSLFERLWKNSITATDRIHGIEEGIESANIEIIENPIESIKLAYSLIKSANQEVLLIFATANAFRRQIRMGASQMLKEKAAEGTNNKNLKIRLLVPADDQITQLIEEAKRLMSPFHDIIDVRSIEESLRSRITILIVDRKESMIWGLKDDTRDTSYEAVGLATYSDSKSIVLSFSSIFENLWRQTELYEQIRETNKRLELANEQLKTIDIMQKDFISIASHELRTPVQTILGFVSLATKGQIEVGAAWKSVLSEARRLQRLTNDILDVSRIESGTLACTMGKARINDIILDIVNAEKPNLNQDLSIETMIESSRDLEIYLDKNRISQAIFNIINNAIKFTNIGTIKIETNVCFEKKKLEIKVSDTGNGIPIVIIPKLFGKFVTRSHGDNINHGTGLGLYIAKAIIHAHKGEISASNKNDGSGAIFTITLPMVLDQ